MDNQKIQEHVQTVREALKEATPDWHDNGNEIVSKLNLRCGIGGFLKDEDNYLAANSPTWHKQSIEIIEQQQREVDGLKEESAHYWNVMLSATADNERLRQEIERLNSKVESLEKGWDTNG